MRSFWVFFVFVVCSLFVLNVERGFADGESQQPPRIGFAAFEARYRERFPKASAEDLENAYQKAVTLLAEVRGAAQDLANLRFRLEKGTVSAGSELALTVTGGISNASLHLGTGFGWHRHFLGRQIHFSLGTASGLSGYGLGFGLVGGSWSSHHANLVVPAIMEGTYFNHFFSEGSDGDMKEPNGTGQAKWTGQALGLSSFRANALRQWALALPFVRPTKAGQLYLRAYHAMDKVITAFRRFEFSKLDGTFKEPWEKTPAPGLSAEFMAAVDAVKKAVEPLLLKETVAIDRNNTATTTETASLASSPVAPGPLASLETLYSLQGAVASRFYAPLRRCARLLHFSLGAGR